MSQAWRRLAQKTSAVGLVSTLVLFVGSVLAMSSPAQAAAVEPLKITYKCTGGYLPAESVQVTVTAPASVEPSKTASIKWTFPAMKAAKPIAAQASVTTSGGDLTVTGGTPTPLKGNGSGTVNTAVQADLTYTPPEMTASVNVTATTGGNLVLAPVTTTTSPSLTITVAGEATTCTYTSATPTSISVPVQTGGGGGSGTDIAEYECRVGSSTTDVQDVEIKVELTMPTSAKVGEQFAIKWKGTYTQGQELKAPTTGQTISAKIFPYASLTGISGLTSATGEGTTGAITAGQIITLPTTTTIDLKSTANAAGTVTVKPGKINFGSNAATGTQPAIECTVQNETALKSYTFTVSSSTASPSPSPTPSSSSPKPTKTSTHTVTVTPSSKKTTRSKTPKAGADTGGGGEIGPDGRLFILTGTALIGAAAVGGLIMRRRSIRG
ncbi:hypothetical protein [Nonomuraea sp. NPDC049400]|uniref:hypothetical protein n=1 Tax=Nonomuraea sp. NPDC049400 TaxID=3364352 RepID=UPI0037B85056